MTTGLGFLLLATIWIAPHCPRSIAIVGFWICVALSIASPFLDLLFRGAKP